MARLLLLPGDFIGPEVTGEVARVAARTGQRSRYRRAALRRLGLDLYGEPLSPLRTLQTALASDAVLMGLAGRRGRRLEMGGRSARQAAGSVGLLGLRKAMDVHANTSALRSASGSMATSAPEARSWSPGSTSSSSASSPAASITGEPRGIETLPDGQKRAVDTQVYTTHEIERVARVAFQMARGRKNKVTSCEKANVMETGVLWREVVTELHAREFADVELSEHMLFRFRQRRHAAGAPPGRLRRDRDGQSVRRHSLGRGGDADRLAGHAALRRAQRRGRPSASTSPSTAQPPTSPGRGSPTCWPPSSPSRWRSAGPSAAPTSPIGSPPRSKPPSTPAPAPPTSAERPRQER